MASKVTEPAPAAPEFTLQDREKMIRELEELRRFLNGEAPIDGYWFGDTYPRHNVSWNGSRLQPQPYWWRRLLWRMDWAIMVLKGE
jgi:hypothetical protein